MDKLENCGIDLYGSMGVKVKKNWYKRIKIYINANII